MKWVYIVLGIVVLFILGIIIFIGSNSDISNKEDSSEGTGQQSGTNEGINGETNGGTSDDNINGNTPTDTSSETHTVLITNGGFSPSTLTISQGDAVEFINQKESASWLASAVHPTHKVYPGSDIQKCGTSQESLIFDACRGIQTGEKYVFTFNEVGAWNYHDHLQSSRTGKIIVN